MAYRYYDRAAEQGNAVAQYLVCDALMSPNQKGVFMNPKEAAKWCRKAAEQGHVRSQLLLGAMYYDGFGVERDVKEGARLLNLIMESSPADSMWYKAAKESMAQGEKNAAAKAAKDATAGIPGGAPETLAEKVAKVKDPESGKNGGPSTADVLKSIGMGDETVPKQQNQDIQKFLDLASTTVRSILNVKELKRGRTLTSTGGGKIPAGTTLFPIRLTADVGNVTVVKEYLFYKNDYDEWNSEERK